MPGSGSAASQLDALQSQLEEGNAVLLHEAAPVLELLSADALSADPAQVGSKALIQRRFSTFPSHLACGGAGFENCLLACVLKCSCPPFVPFVLFFSVFPCASPGAHPLLFPLRLLHLGCLPLLCRPLPP